MDSTRLIGKKIREISNIDINPLLSAGEARKVQLTNQIVIVLALATIPYILIFNILGAPLLGWLIIPVFTAFVFCIVLNHFQHYWASRMLFVLLANAAAFYYSAKLGATANVHHLYFAFVGFPLLLFEFHRTVSIFVSIIIPFGCYFLLLANFNQKWIPLTPLYEWSLLWISVSAGITVFWVIILYLISIYKSHQRYEDSLLESNTTLQTAYADLQLQQNLLEKTWQEYGFTSKLSGTLRLSEIVDLTAKTILLHFGLTYAAPITSNNTSTLHTWTLENQIPVCTREDSFESQICYTYEKGPILPLSVAHLSTSVLDIMNPTPSLVLHLAITENESRYILIGPKNSGVAFSESDMKLLNALSTQAIIALQRALPYEDAVHRYGMAIKQESAYQMLVSLQHQINSPLSAAKMAMDTLSKTPMETNMSIIAKMGKEALDSVAAVMRRMRHVSQLKETNYLGDIKMWDIGEPDDT